MAADRVKIQDIVASQLPTYVREDFPLLAEFLQQYYISQEFEGATYDLVQNLDQYVKVDELFQLTTETVLASNLSYTDRTITADVSGNFTYGFPETNGLIKIDNEIIAYEYKTDSTFEGCTRGFSGVTSYTGSNTPDQLVFEETEADKHTAGATISNLNILFLQEFFKKIKYQFAPGFTERTLYSGLDQRNFVFGLDSFYNSKGTDESFKILFQALYGVDVNVIRPSQFLLRPSNADYKVTLDFVVETIQGNPLDLQNLTLFQKSTGARGSVTNVAPIDYDEGQYYQISIDTGYQRDIDVQGTIFGEFKVNPKTKLLNSVGAGTTILDVDSAVDFPESGDLITTDVDENIIYLSYNGKTNTQLLNVSGVDYSINEQTDIRIDDYSYAYVGISTSDEIRVRIAASLKGLVPQSETYGYLKGDIVNIQSLGYQSPEEKSKNWLVNVKTSWDVETITVVDLTENTYEIGTFDDQFFKPGYVVNLINGITKVKLPATVLRSTSSTSFVIRSNDLISIGDPYKVENQILKGNSTSYPQLNDFFANIQNTYTKFNGDVLVASNSIARYSNKETNPYSRSVNFSGDFYNTYDIVVDNHGFYSGQSIYYQPGVTKTTTTTPDGIEVVTETESKFNGVDAGVYYVKRVNETTFNLARSKSDIFAGKLILLTGSVENNTITLFDFYQKNIEEQPIYREFTTPVSESNRHETFNTEFGHTGILINGVEVINYKSRDSVRYGEIKNIDVSSGGSGYDVITPPVLHISDEVGTGATGTCSVDGSLQRVEIVDSGFDYQGTPEVNILGGNGKGAVAKANMISVTHNVFFNADSGSYDVNLTNDTVGFATFHKFRDNEIVTYYTQGGTNVGGLSTGSRYYVAVQDSSTIKLHITESDSVLGVNTVNLTSYGSGTHFFRSQLLKRIVSDIVVSNSGSGYENKQRNIPSLTGINTALNRFIIPDHGYSNKEIVKYTPSGTSVIGLSSTKEYYVVKVNADEFSLTEVGVGSTAVDYFYDNNILTNVENEGSGSFNYKPITVTVDGVTGVSTRTGQDFNAVVQPIFRGEISSIDVSSTGVGYGSSEILNFDRQPDITFVSGADAAVTPIISNGKIVEVVVGSKGYGYNSPPNLTISSNTGNFAVLTPIVNDGKLVEVKVIKGGAGYESSNTSVTVTPAGQGARTVAKVRNWTVNLFAERFANIKPDDGFITQNVNDSSLQYSAMYAPRPLRESVYGISGTNEDNTVYGSADLTISGNVEVDSDFHSPIIGWAYDGNPIYGPYGFANVDGTGAIRRMVSSYELGSITSRDNSPPLTTWSNGFFVEDFIYTGNGDLDQHNGRFCITPDYPQGVYAYFTTINSTVDSFGPFEGFRRPAFPYLIGNSYQSKPNNFNFRSVSNQTDYDIEGDGWFRETTPYHTDGSYSGYNYLFDSSKVTTQYAEITATSAGTIENIGIVTGGQNYKVGDKVIFNNEGSGGRLATAKVSRVAGNTINTVSASSTSFENVEFTRNTVNSNRFIGFTTAPHNYLNGDVVNISGVSTFYSGFEGSYPVGVRSDNFVLTLGVQTTGVTGIVTYFYVSGAFDNSHVRENDILQIESEKVKVLNIDARTGRLRVRREEEGTTAAGYAYTSGGVLYEDPRKFYVNVGLIKTDYSFPINRELYFDPAESVAIGTVTGTGIGSTVTFSDPGVGRTNIFIQPQQFYYPGHRLKLNEKVVYETNGGNPIQVWNGVSGTDYADLSDFSPLYAVPFTENFVGFGTNKVGLNSTGGYVGVGTDSGLLYFTSVGTGNTHSFTTNLTGVLSGKVSRNIVTVSTATTHTLQTGDFVYVTIKPVGVSTITVKYDNYNRRIVFDPKDFVAGDVDTTLNTIQISNNSFQFGDRVIHTSTSPSGGLVDEGMYYVIPYDANRIRLVADKFELSALDPKFVNLTSASTGTLSKINPAVQVTKNNTVKFDLSDSSLSFVVNGIIYSAFDMNLYSDVNFVNLFVKTPNSTKFEVIKNGRPGIDSDAYLQLEFSDDIPDQLFYRFDLDNESIITDVKKEISIDTTVPNNNQLNVVLSPYDGQQIITGIGSTSFTYDIPTVPTTTQYNFVNSVPEYETNSTNVTGPISKFKIDGPGVGYKTLPGITSVRSSRGSGAIVQPQSTNIGRVLESQLNNIGFDYPSDFTVRPVANLPEILKVESLSSFDTIGIASQGRNYLVAPNLVVLDGFTNNVVSGLDLAYHLGDEEVTIITNVTGIYNVPPTILPVNNSNGLGISSVTFDSSTKTARAYIDRNFTTAEASQFNFSVGDTILVENVSVGVGSTGTGYNSSDYNYTLFEVSDLDKKLDSTGGYIEYRLSDVLPEGDFPGNYDEVNSYGRVINQKDFPIYVPTLKTNNYFNGENVTNGSGVVGRVERWNNTTEQLIVSSGGEFNVGDTIIGRSSDTRSVVQSKVNFNSQITTGAGSTVIDGWQTDSGFLNDNLQKLPNNEYYQNFSYSLDSTIPYQTWNDPVSSLDHTAGFAKFADLEIISKEESTTSIVQTFNSNVERIHDLVGEASLNCEYDWALASETTVVLGNDVISKEIVFNDKILTDYEESVGNRVLRIDDFSSTFNSVERTTPYVTVSQFDDNEIFNKILTLVQDKTTSDNRQASILSLLQENGIGYINEYATVESNTPLGTFDVIDTLAGWDLTFNPVQFAYDSYDVSTLAFNIADNAGISSTNFGSIVNVSSATTTVGTGTTQSIVSIGTTYRSAKVLVLVKDQNNEATGTELNLVHDGTTVTILEYGNLMSDGAPLFSGIGTFGAEIVGSNLNVNYTPNVGVETVTTYSSIIAIASTSTNTGSTDLETGQLNSSYKSIPSETSPYAVTVASYDDPYKAAYYLLSVEDTTNSKYELIEFVVLNSSSNQFFVQFGETPTDNSTGTVGVAQTVGTQIDITFTPNANSAVQVRTFGMPIQIFDGNGEPTNIDLETLQINSGNGSYVGTKLDLQNTFGLKNNGLEIFRRSFDGSDAAIANTSFNTVSLPDHFFVTGENVNYGHPSGGAIGIVTATVPSIGSTDKLPNDLFVVKIDDSTLKFASTAENALKEVPVVLEINSVGIGTSHSITAKNQNSKTLLAIDNMIQSPVSKTKITSTLSASVILDQVLETSGITSFFPGDVIKVDDEFMTVTGLGGNNATDLQVLRGQLGTLAVPHTVSATITKFVGQYNIVGNSLVFVDAPYGQTPLSTTSNPNQADYAGITTHSTFQGRVFTRNAASNSVDETYTNNYVFDDISDQFTGITSVFTLLEDDSNVVGFSTYNACILYNGVFQQPNSTSTIGGYDLSEASGITSITFQGTGVQDGYDPNKTNLPLRGKIVSVTSVQGFGYQPLVSAGGTANVSAAGTITSISIGNTGSGYRSGIQTVNVGVQTYSDGVPNLEFIGTAAISGGHIVSIAITNPGTGYTSTNPPEVYFDAPLSYTNIPLVYTSGSSGVGTGGQVDIIVGQASSVTNFVVSQPGFNYGNDETLTIEVGGTTGIPTDTTKTFANFELTIQSLGSDSFSGWNFGSLQVIDSLDSKFDGETQRFTLTIDGVEKSFLTSVGSPVNIEENLIVYINDILQEPTSAYQFSGGSQITFSEAPQLGDTSKILFYRGTEDVDIVDVEIIKNVKRGDTLELNHDVSRGQSKDLDQDPRTVSKVVTSDLVETNPYGGPGVTQDATLLRPVTWCRQTVDKIINGEPIGKNRDNYEPNIFGVAYLLQPVGVGSTIVYVDNVTPIFDQFNELAEADLGKYQRKINITSQDTLTAAAATAIVSTAGTISSFDVTTAGFGYTVAPAVTVQTPVGLGTTQRATGTAVLSGSTVSSITVTAPGTGYTGTSVPEVLIEPPVSVIETSVPTEYAGDFGIIVGVGTTTSGSDSQIYFDTFIPLDSVIRDYTYVGLGSTSISGISTGDYLVITNTNLSVGGTFASRNTAGGHVGLATTALDCVYQVESFEDNDQIIHQGSLVGFTTTLRRIFVNVDNSGSIGYTTAPYMGDFSWGKITIPNRIDPQTFSFYGDNGVTGVSTSGVIARYNPLKAVGYTTV